MKIFYSRKIQIVIRKKNIPISKIPFDIKIDWNDEDGSVSSFERGINFAIKVKDKQIQAANYYNEGIMYFIGTEEEILEKLK